VNSPSKEEKHTEVESEPEEDVSVEKDE